MTTTVGGSYVVDGKPARIGVGIISIPDLRDLKVPIQEDEIDYEGKSCFVVVEAGGEPVQALQLKNDQLHVQDGKVGWEQRLWHGVNELLRLGIIHPAE